MPLFDGRTCDRCGCASGLLVIWWWRPASTHRWGGGEYTNPAMLAPYRAMCLAQEACRARVSKRDERRRVRASMIVLEEPAAPDAPYGVCRWCGEGLTGKNGSRRNYCRKDREGRDCVGAWNRSRAWSARDAVRWRDLREHGEVWCADCGVVCETKATGLRPEVSWEADHEVALEDGGLHDLANLRARCGSCHRWKTGRENRARAMARREVAGVGRGYDAQIQLAIEEVVMEATGPTEFDPHPEGSAGGEEMTPLSVEEEAEREKEALREEDVTVSDQLDDREEEGGLS